MKQVRRVGLFLICILALVWICSCSDIPEPAPPLPDPVVTISTDKTSIKANNKDKAVFTVKVDGKDVTQSIVITQKTKNTPLEGMSFSTDSSATYIFFATYNNLKSNEITINAIDIEVIITADKQTIKANDKDIVTFSVEADGEDVTSSAEILQTGVSESILNNAGFYTKIPGSYSFYATYNGKKSNEIHVNVSAIMLSLSVDKTSIKANNWDKSTFTVKADDENVTSFAVIMQRKTNNNDIALKNHEFLTDEAATYTFYAVYADTKSNEVSIETTSMDLAFLKGYSVVQISSTACPNCPKMTDELIKLQQSLPDRIHVITLHPAGKYCDSDLSGALAATAVHFVDNVDTYAPPLAIIDINYAVHLYAKDTQTPLHKAVDQATVARDRVSLTGMAVQSKTSDNWIDFTVSFRTLKTDNYRFFAFVVEDGVVNRQALAGNTNDPNFIHNNVATYQLNEGDPFRGINLGTITAGSETTRSFSIDMNNFKTGRNVNLANCRIICYTLKSNNGDSYVVDNATSCPVDGSVRYLYEK